MLLYADCTGTGEPAPEIDDLLRSHVLPYYGNTHSDSYCSNMMTAMIELSRTIVKKECIDSEYENLDDHAVIFTGQGMTGAARHFAHSLKFRVSSIVYTVLEHVSNSALWESVFPDAHVSVVKVSPTSSLIDIGEFQHAVHRRAAITTDTESVVLVAFTACSNVLGDVQPVDELLDVLQRSPHRNRIVTCVDCAAIAPYIQLGRLCTHADVRMISPHKFRGGYSTPGVLVVRKRLLDKRRAPFYPGGGTVWYRDDKVCSQFLDDLEHREEGGTPNIIGIIRTGLVFEVKRISQATIIARTFHIVRLADNFFMQHPTLMRTIKLFSNVGHNQFSRLPIYSFQVHGCHPGLFVTLLSDVFGIQARSGVSCCYLLAAKLCRVNRSTRKSILEGKGTPETYGWVRLSFYYRHTDDFVLKVLRSVVLLIDTLPLYVNDYEYRCAWNRWVHRHKQEDSGNDVKVYAKKLFAALS